MATKTNPMTDAFPAAQYLKGDKGKEIGSVKFDDSVVNVLDEECGFSQELADETFTFEMGLSAKVTLFLFKINVSSGSAFGPIQLRMKVNDAMTMLNQEIKVPATIDKAWDVSNDALIQFYLSDDVSKARLDVRVSALAFLQLHGKTQKYLDLSIASRSAFGDVHIRVGCLPQ